MLKMVVLMVDKITLPISSSIRTNSSDKLSRKISFVKMHNSLIDLFIDRTAIDTSLNLFGDKEAILETMRYNNCKHLNDDRTIEFNQSWKQEDDVFDEDRQIWIDRYIDVERDDMFVPRDDA